MAERGVGGKREMLYLQATVLPRMSYTLLQTPQGANEISIMFLLSVFSRPLPARFNKIRVEMWLHT